MNVDITTVLQNVAGSGIMGLAVVWLAKVQQDTAKKLNDVQEKRVNDTKAMAQTLLDDAVEQRDALNALTQAFNNLAQQVQTVLTRREP